MFAMNSENSDRSGARRARFLFALLGCATIISGSAIAGPPFRTDGAGTLDYRHWEAHIFTAGTDTKGGTGGVLSGLEVNYGAAPDLQLHGVLPIAFNDPRGAGTQAGIGDIELGVKYSVIPEQEDGWRPQVAIYPNVELSSGDAAKGLGAGKTRVFLPVWLQKTIASVTVMGGAGYWINPGIGNKDYWYTGLLMKKQVAPRLSLGAEVFHQTASSFGGVDSTGMNFGGTFDITERFHILASAGSGLQNASATNRVSYYLGFQWTP